MLFLNIVAPFLIFSPSQRLIKQIFPAQKVCDESYSDIGEPQVHITNFNMPRLHPVPALRQNGKS